MVVEETCTNMVVERNLYKYGGREKPVQIYSGRGKPEQNMVVEGSLYKYGGRENPVQIWW